MASIHLKIQSVVFAKKLKLPGMITCDREKEQQMVNLRCYQIFMSNPPNVRWKNRDDWCKVNK